MSGLQILKNTRKQYFRCNYEEIGQNIIEKILHRRTKTCLSHDSDRDIVVLHENYCLRLKILLISYQLIIKHFALSRKSFHSAFASLEGSSGYTHTERQRHIGSHCNALWRLKISPRPIPKRHHRLALDDADARRSVWVRLIARVADLHRQGLDFAV